MYKLRTPYFGQMNITFESVNKPGIDFNIHWLNPQLSKCVKQRYPDEVN